jgi:Leucine-rich repeat (LRR) protein
LILFKNELTSLPENIGKLEKLTEVDLNSNELEALPDSISNLKNLKSVNLGKNSFSQHSKVKAQSLLQHTSVNWS